MAKITKTNVMRLLEQADIPFKAHQFNKLAQARHVDVFKTLVTVGKSGAYYVFLVPLTEELDLKKAAKSVQEKSLAMIKEKELLPLTGYVHGGCSPIGMKKELPTIIDQSAITKENIIFSAGKRGMSVEAKPEDIQAFLAAEFANVIKIK